MNYNTRLASTGLPSGCGSDKPLHRSAHHSHVRCRLVSISASVSILVAVFVSVFWSLIVLTWLCVIIRMALQGTGLKKVLGLDWT